MIFLFSRFKFFFLLWASCLILLGCSKDSVYTAQIEFENGTSIQYKGDSTDELDVWFHKHSSSRDGTFSGAMMINEFGAFRWKVSFESGKLSGLYRYGLEYKGTFTETLLLNYVDGVRNGPVSAFYMNGKMQYSGNYNNDHKDGRFEFFYSNGQPAMTCSFLGGLLDGELLAWDRVGRKVAAGTYRGGKPWDGTLLLNLDDFISTYETSTKAVDIALFRDGKVIASDSVFLHGLKFRDVRKKLSPDPVRHKDIGNR